MIWWVLKNPQKFHRYSRITFYFEIYLLCECLDHSDYQTFKLMITTDLHRPTLCLLFVEMCNLGS